MPRYLVERPFPEGLEIPLNDTGAALCRQVVANNAEEGVTWLHLYATHDRKRTFCVYDGPTPEAIRRAAVPGRIHARAIPSGSPPRYRRTVQVACYHRHA